mmetsp:Transcript_35820/g.32226  ORF Transcript_35820/g.32226 Transcript_35820/m.32226 type:complete len:89 (+) Transcript_35820:392-658(+)
MEVVQRNMIANQAIVGTYLEKRLRELDETLLGEKKKLFLQKLLLKKDMGYEDQKRIGFNRWRNCVKKWRLSFKLTILKKKTELETEKK